MPKCKTCTKEIALGAQFVRVGFDGPDGQMEVAHLGCYSGPSTRIYLLTQARADVIEKYRAKQVSAGPA